MIKKNIAKKRYIVEFLFKNLGLCSIVSTIAILCILIFSIFSKGYTSFYTHYLTLEVPLVSHNEDANYEEILSGALNAMLKKSNIENIDTIQTSDLLSSISINELQDVASTLKNSNKVKLQKIELLVSSNVDMVLKHCLGAEYLLNEETIQAVENLKKQGLIRTKFNSLFFKNSDSRYPELAGIKGAFLGTVYTISLTIIFSVIISIGAGIYLEEFAPKNRLINIIEININNLAAVPSIVFGLLGLTIFQHFLGVPRATPLLASFVLTLMSLPTIIIATRVALSSVPNSIKEAAYGMGASKVQVVILHLLPLSMPSILTGIIISISRVLGETAPLLMIGMVAFMNNTPSSILSNAVAFPVQILLWSDSPEIGFIEKASAASMLLLIFLLFINWLSIYLRNKFEVKL